MTADMVPPPTLDEVAAAKWTQLHAARAGTGRAWRPVELDALEAYCAAYSRWRAATAWLDEHGDVMTIRDDKGTIRSSAPAPKLAVAERARKAMTELLPLVR
jgi:phage terminase small subunit